MVNKTKTVSIAKREVLEINKYQNLNLKQKQNPKY